MGKRYFCDYCDRSFQDNLHNRKKHLNGVQHLRAKKVWYDLFRGGCPPEGPAWFSSCAVGQCDFDSNCRFSHMTSGDLEQLAAQVHEERLSRDQETVEVPEGGIEDWLEKWAKRRSSAQSSRYPSRGRYPPGWPPIQDLPPSLRAPPPGGWPQQPSAQWG
uniref:Zinc finger matrin-type protein 5 n=1 Tax=Vombatus ursinus TaxID=29139 RepID=A0A4X2KX00_VOMUR